MKELSHQQVLYSQEIGECTYHLIETSLDRIPSTKFQSYHENNSRIYEMLGMDS